MGVWYLVIPYGVIKTRGPTANRFTRTRRRLVGWVWTSLQENGWENQIEMVVIDGAWRRSLPRHHRSSFPSAVQVPQPCHPNAQPPKLSSSRLAIFGSPPSRREAHACRPSMHVSDP
ncbi:alpha/beta hydrolase [Sesbania bispinosa]|nr:alpha/beta hydrolase [Sesbania bispinosa]